MSAKAVWRVWRSAQNPGNPFIFPLILDRRRLCTATASSVMWGGGDEAFFETVNESKIIELLDRRSHSGAAGIDERIRGMKWLLAVRRCPAVMPSVQRAPAR